MARLQLTGEKATMLGTLYGRALDAESAHPILNDTMARDAVRAIDFDFRETGLRQGDQVTVALRAEHLDTWTRQFLDAHPEAVVLHLGCGLDTRVYRVDPGPGVRWFDVDYPEVVELRRELYPPREGYEVIGSSVTDPAWFARVPGDRPVLVVAEGLTMYLRAEEGKALLRRIVGHFPSGQIVFDGFSTRGIRMQKINRIVRKAKATLYWGIDDAAELEAAAAGLRCVTTLSAFELDYGRLGAGYRALARVGRRVPVLRRMAVFYRLEF
ncbi:class I SAM-dependent methyltransferase [Sphaerisporangium sp. TRM90804]|uniref:class I SAM-dependent methyltransferase n=1 Tax=Sphaerisporangium sp. TRM90804 TaxID=3031113 RepID=UPI00244B0FC4|nr:class I SAM-dependent methyltransferase [Sphaerisporangium sp. TRM90804]MDH2429998.1 class I SAM-dependent methyltransferase [Sphaerisporangium sp. TRM90804]